MKKIYYVITCIGVFLMVFTAQVNAQQEIISPKSKISRAIDGLQVFPNPVSGDKVYITSTSNKTKTVTAYNVLGKRVLFKVLIGKELNISALSPGLYILKIKEGDLEATVKLFRN
ncbi:T9SS type A sorting domain-containing protein [Aquimarina brevivitae]|uniref:Putative secreted protein (Por secretion system target) n=1 Tax=Aquimarina brevivitae TaxID=323412 RepID=A0A4Q7PIK8_9FLAO|nr:T9SS type A sorting domain-containing protein [Aquimarina brevivitae]RZS99650.1 putative secreted protein (Por secretion system target) [Aquimarina brevivitae]